LPSAAASCVAGTSKTRRSAQSSAVASHTLAFRRSTEPGRSFARSGAKKRGCIASADHARATMGGVEIGASATTSVASVLPPRMVPP
jgi:hypothetical protein